MGIKCIFLLELVLLKIEEINIESASGLIINLGDLEVSGQSF